MGRVVRFITFQSTLSEGRATSAQLFADIFVLFQSTLSEGRATTPVDGWVARKTFQSTLSEGRATLFVINALTTARISIHALRGESD